MGDIERSGLTLRWLGQAGWLVQGGGVSVLFDPWLSEHSDRLEAPEAVDALPDGVTWLLASHEHLDHLDLPSLPALAARYPGLHVLVATPLVERVRAAVPGVAVTGVQPGDVIAAGTATIRAVRAFHGVTMADGYTDGYGLTLDGRTPFAGFVVEFPGITVYHAGDTVIGDGMVDELAPLGIDLCFLPINGRDRFREDLDIVGNIDGREAVELAVRIGARMLVPMHFEMFRGNTVPVGPVVDLARSRGLSVLLPARGTEVTVGL